MKMGLILKHQKTENIYYFFHNFLHTKYTKNYEVKSESLPNIGDQTIRMHFILFFFLNKYVTY